MGINVSTYYYSAKRRSDQEALEKIERICEKLPALGYRKVSQILSRQSKINHKRVYRIMKDVRQKAS